MVRIAASRTSCAIISACDPYQPVARSHSARQNLSRKSLNMIERIVVLAMLTIGSGTLPAQELSPQPGYSVETLSQSVYDTAEVAVHSAAFNNWLIENHQQLDPDQEKGAREFLYYLIDSHVKGIYAREGQILPKEPDLILQTLFSWSERLGVYGGSYVFNKIRLPSEPEMSVLLHPPPSMAISMQGDLLRIESASKKWGFSVPYYFMPYRVTEFTATNGMPTQFLTISTGAATDSSDDGRSQATLMLIYSPDVDYLEFREFWTEQIGIPTDATQSELDFEELTGKYYYDAATKIHTEALIWQSGPEAFALTYGGVDGTYQWNRQHFLDFLTSLHQSQ